MITSTNSDEDFASRWAIWLSQPAGMTDAEAAQAVTDLLEEFRHSATPATLIAIILGDAYRELSRTIVPVARAEASAAELRAAGYIVRIEQGNAVVALRRLPNLHELTCAGRVARGPLVAALEMECRNVDGRIPRPASVTVMDQLSRWRRLFIACLLDGVPPPKPIMKVDEGPASECPSSDAPAQPAEVAQSESEEPEQARAAESSEQPKAQKDADVPIRYDGRGVWRSMVVSRQGGPSGPMSGIPRSKHGSAGDR